MAANSLRHLHESFDCQQLLSTRCLTACHLLSLCCTYSYMYVCTYARTYVCSTYQRSVSRKILYPVERVLLSASTKLIIFSFCIFYGEKERYDLPNIFHIFFFYIDRFFWSLENIISCQKLFGIFRKFSGFLMFFPSKNDF